MAIIVCTTVSLEYGLLTLDYCVFIENVHIVYKKSFIGEFGHEMAVGREKCWQLATNSLELRLWSGFIALAD